jgi:hypothetical protein
MNRVNRTPGLGEDSVLGPLPVLQVPTFGVDSNLLVAGAGVLAVVWVLRNLGGRVSDYTRTRARKSRRRKALKEELRNL